MSRQKKSKRKSSLNFLPADLAASFQLELTHLVDELALTEGFKGRYLQSEFKSKFLDPQGSISALDRRSAAIKKWHANEKKNARTNIHLMFDECDFSWSSSMRIEEKAKEIIASVLGPFNIDEILTFVSHSNGASTRISRGANASLLKLAGKAHSSTRAVGYWDSLTVDTVLEAQDLVAQEESVLFTVPKKSEIDRVACKEPEINMTLQRAVGKYIRHKLKRVGIDLRDQTRNQKLAKVALVDDLATVDLSAASDSITTQCVLRLLPLDYFWLLDELRVHTTLIDGVPVDLNMFSSMGNGFTFELESLLFYALTRATAWATRSKGVVSVYGDDIICSRFMIGQLTDVFAWYGFSINAKKSHSTGLFRESCGKHYHNSLDVTPFYLRVPIRQKTDVIRFLNHLLKWDGRSAGTICTKSIYHFHKKWSKIIPRCLHGGVNPNDDTALVTVDKPRKRLLRLTKPIDTESSPQMIWWLFEAEAKPSYNLSLISPTFEIYTSLYDGNYDWFHTSTQCDPADTTNRYELTTNVSWPEAVHYDPYRLFDPDVAA